MNEAQARAMEAHVKEAELALQALERRIRYLEGRSSRSHHR